MTGKPLFAGDGDCRFDVLGPHRQRDADRLDLGRWDASVE